MSKYHISSNGQPALCKATDRPCPLGGESEHFNSIAEAFEHIESKYSQDGYLSTPIPSERARKIKLGFCNITLSLMRGLYTYGSGLAAGLRTGAQTVPGQSTVAQIVRSFGTDSTSVLKLDTSGKPPPPKPATSKDYEDFISQKAPQK